MASFEEIVRRIVREEVRAALQELLQRRDELPLAARADDILSLKDAAVVLGVAEATLRDWRVDRIDPPAIKYGRLVFYRRDVLMDWIADHAEQVAAGRKRGNHLLGLDAAAELLGVAPQTMYNWRSERKGPKAVKVGSLVKYRREDLDQWIADQTK